ncbi:MAG: hypothetical protein QJR09_08120 [Micrococcus sp.]|nr:hypothetical protein [Micrococcus sp.]
MKNRGRACPCGHGRGFRREQIARHVHDQMTLTPTRYYQCEHGLWHWYPEETTNAAA